MTHLQVDSNKHHVEEYFDDLFRLSNWSYSQISTIKNEFNIFYLEFKREISQLNLKNNRNKAFIYLLFDISERLQIPYILSSLNSIIKNDSNLVIGSRLRAALLYSVKTYSDNSLYIEKFDEICHLLDWAIQNEEDDEKKSLVTFANYYLAVLDKHERWIRKLRLKIEENKTIYKFLSSEFICEILKFDITDIETCWNNIQELKDRLLNRKELSIKSGNEYIIECNTDYANYIKSLSNVSFEQLRDYAIKKVANKTLGHRGVKPLNSEEDLYVYMKSYGNMHYAKIRDLITLFPWENLGWQGPCYRPLELNYLNIIDWGCGQGIAVFALLEELIKSSVWDNLNVTLIEPSEMALKRASLHIKAFNPQEVKTICSDFDNLKVTDIQSSNQKVNIHIFSNVLDIENFSLERIENLIEKTYRGQNYFICVSPYISDLKAERFNSFMNYFKKYPTFAQYSHLENSKYSNDYWNCNNNYNQRKCTYHTEYGCEFKWTRIVNIFSVDL